MNGSAVFDDDAAAGGVDVDAARGFLAFASAGSSAGFAGVALRPRAFGPVDIARGSGYST